MDDVVIKQMVRFYVGEREGFGHANLDVPVESRRVETKEIKFNIDCLKKIKVALKEAIEKSDFVSIHLDSYPGCPKPEVWTHNSDSEDYCGVEYDSEYDFWMFVYPSGCVKLAMEYRLYADGARVEGYEAESERFIIGGWVKGEEL